MNIKAYGKINLTLDVVSKREDGYHNLRMVMMRVSLFDEIEIKINTGTGKIITKTNLKFIKQESNTMFKACLAFFQKTKVSHTGIYIRAKKQIPSSAGMAGGSADAAAVILALNQLFACNLSMDELCEIGVKVGADVPFCLLRKTALCEGIGEVMTPLSDIPKAYFVLVKPGFGMSTPKVFGQLKIDDIKRHPNTEGMLKAIEKEDLKEIAGYLYNVLEEIVVRSNPEILKVKESLLKLGALNAIMTGSGSVVYGLFDNEKSALTAQNELKKRYKDTFFATNI